MTIGPVEYILVGFPGNQFNGEIAPELVDLVESGTIRILDLIFIGKDVDGSVVAFEIDELDAATGFGRLDGDVGGLISPGRHRVCRRGTGTELIGRTVDLGGCLGGALRRGGAQVQRSPARRCPLPPRAH